MYITIDKLREHEADYKLLKSLRKTYADDAPIKIVDIFASNGIEDALYCLRAVEGYDKEIRLYAVWCVRQVQHLMADERSRAALDVAERYAYGRASDAELYAARAAASTAAASTAASTAASAAGAAEAAAGAAASAAWAAAWEAAAGAASAAASAASAARAAGAAAAGAASAAAGAAWAAVRNAQAAKLCEVCELIEATHVHNIK